MWKILTTLFLSTRWNKLGELSICLLCSCLNEYMQDPGYHLPEPFLRAAFSGQPWDMRHSCPPQRTSKLTACSKSGGFLKLSVPQMWHRPTACVASTWASCHSQGLLSKRNHCKYTENSAACCVMSNKTFFSDPVLRLLPESIKQ